MIIREPRDQLAFDQSPGLIAVFHALHRLLAPRHPPHALGSLAALIHPLMQRIRLLTELGSPKQGEDLGGYPPMVCMTMGLE
jgi:hypothetical protein